MGWDKALWCCFLYPGHYPVFLPNIVPTSCTACLLRKYITLSASHEYILIYSKWVSLFGWLWNGSSQSLCCLSLHVACCSSLVRVWMLMLNKLISCFPVNRIDTKTERTVKRPAPTLQTMHSPWCHACYVCETQSIKGIPSTRVTKWWCFRTLNKIVSFDLLPMLISSAW